MCLSFQSVDRVTLQTYDAIIDPMVHTVVKMSSTVDSYSKMTHTHTVHKVYP